jgi:putative ubiquitin-RnfH superfamily antitoxin RatB of RatAB toxin-antitoxin module
MCAGSRLLTLVAIVLASACSPEPKQAAPAPVVAPAPPPPPPPPPVSADDLPPRQRVEADGITLTEYVDGRVRVQSTFVWNEALDATYDNCDFYRGAIPVLSRQLAPERVKHLAEMCVVAAPPVLDPKAARRAKALAALAAKAKAKPPKVAQPAP